MSRRLPPPRDLFLVKMPKTRLITSLVLSRELYLSFIFVPFIIFFQVFLIVQNFMRPVFGFEMIFATPHIWMGRSS